MSAKVQRYKYLTEWTIVENGGDRCSFLPDNLPLNSETDKAKMDSEMRITGRSKAPGLGAHWSRAGWAMLCLSQVEGWQPTLSQQTHQILTQVLRAHLQHLLCLACHNFWQSHAVFLSIYTILS